MNLKKMCASHNLILLVSLVTLALVIVLVVKQEREPFRGGILQQERDRRRLGFFAGGNIAGWGYSGRGQRGTYGQSATAAESSRPGHLLAPGHNGGA